jgi:hypothetical protein
MDTNDHQQQADDDARGADDAYSSPGLRVLGSVTELTAGTGNAFPDGVGHSNGGGLSPLH